MTPTNLQYEPGYAQEQDTIPHSPLKAPLKDLEPPKVKLALTAENFVAGNSMCNCTLAEAEQFFSMLEALGVTGGELFACPVGVAGYVDQLIPEAQFSADGVPTLTPAYLMAKFPGNPSYPQCYTIGICMWRIMMQDAYPLSTLSFRKPKAAA